MIYQLNIDGKPEPLPGAHSNGAAMSEFEQYRALFVAESWESIEMLVKNLLAPES